MSLITCRNLSVLFVWIMILMFSGCAAVVPVYEPPIPVERPVEKQQEQHSSVPAEEHPRVAASLQLTEQGRVFLKNGQLEMAIRTFERGVSLAPDNGENYYYLAEIWLMKKRVTQAVAFNRLAGIYLRENAGWVEKVNDQAKRIGLSNDNP